MTFSAEHNILPLSFMSSKAPSAAFSSRHFRIDPEHQVMEMMRSALEHLKHCEVNIQFQQDAVYLTGEVGSWSDKQIAQESIRSILGHRRIENNLRVV